MPAPTIRMSGLFMVHLSGMPRGRRSRSPFDKFTSVAAWCNGDFNADGLIGAQDFIIGYGPPGGDRATSFSGESVVVQFGKIVVFWKTHRNPKRKRGSAFGPRSRFALTIQIAKLYHYHNVRRVDV